METPLETPLSDVESGADAAGSTGNPVQTFGSTEPMMNSRSAVSSPRVSAPDELDAPVQDTDPITKLLERTGANEAAGRVEAWMGAQIHSVAAALRRLLAESAPFKYGSIVVAIIIAVLIAVFHFSADMHRILALSGIVLMLASLAFFSSDRDSINWARAASSLSLQLLMGLLIVTPHSPFRSFFQFLGNSVTVMLSYASKGGDFIFASYDRFGQQTAVARVLVTSMNITVLNGTDGSKQHVNGVADLPISSQTVVGQIEVRTTVVC